VSYDEKTDRMNWNDELSWLLISLFSGFVLSFLFICFDTFPKANTLAVYALCPACFYLLSIAVRIQNHRGKLLTGKTGIKEKYLKYIFPLLGFVIGFAVLFFLR
jgi:hypothetical protein